MTVAPQNLKDARTLILESLPVDPAAVGIVGDDAHSGGYHCGSDRTVKNDYSVVESSRDKTGLTTAASALDVGQFFKGAHNLRTFSAWLVNECAKGAADTKDIREVIYSPDGHSVKRWDREGKRTSGDDSHLWHTHISFYRDATKANRDVRPLFRRYIAYVNGTPAPKPPAPTPAPTKLGQRTVKQGMTGADVSELQTKLNAKGPRLTVDGNFGPATLNAVTAFQRLYSLSPDGIVGPNTVAALLTGLGGRALKQGATGSDVRELQRLLTAQGYKLDQDGEFGPKTLAAVKAFQKNRKLAVDGQAGPKTIGALRK
ncbi:peptidoglycan-binding protein [Micromonospora sp. NBC_01699]|uniref:peptidoglycan-binding domain-containing protein n=1 Tax=Micromonospora sp. NBC_01699 TaxID=2975984 RepID=UPI002E2CC939|nr:peptidoglycan-binding protein [Micromonospora sp. NBC_01699]